MEFKYRDGQIRRTPSPLRHPLFANTYVSDPPLQGGFPSNVSVPRVFPMAMPINVNEVFQRELEKEKIWRELEKKKIRREIIARKMAFAQRQELEDEVRKEIELERTFQIPMQSSEEIAFREPVSMSINHSKLKNIIMPSGLKFDLSSQAYMQINMDNIQINNKEASNKVIIQNKPVNHCGEKRKAVTLAIDENESLQKKAKKWSCELCQISATSEKGLNDHIQGKKHKANKESTRTQNIGKRKKTTLSLKKSKHGVKCTKVIITMISGLDSRPEGQTLHPCLTPTDTCKLESNEKGQIVPKSKDLGGLDNQNETTTSKQAQETTTLPKGNKFKYWCEFCQVQTQSEIVMQSHKNGKKHLANIKKFNHNNGGFANSE